MTKNTAAIVFSNADYYLAHLNDGGIRVGMKDVGALDFPADHPLYADAVALTEGDIEAFIDAQIEVGRWTI